MCQRKIVHVLWDDLFNVKHSKYRKVLSLSFSFWTFKNLIGSIYTSLIIVPFLFILTKYQLFIFNFFDNTGSSQLSEPNIYYIAFAIQSWRK